MHVCVVYAHPSDDSFTAKVLRAFLEGLKAGGHTAEVRDLYGMDFTTDLDRRQYYREMGSDPQEPVPWDVEREQQKLDRAQGLAFIYPVWWADCPAKLKGWFDRVFTQGYAYFRGDPKPDPAKGRTLNIEKAIVLCPAGQTLDHLEEQGTAQSMRCIMLNDRLGGSGIKEASMEILAGTHGDDGTVKSMHLTRAHELGRNFSCSKR
jgi:NAD(P)H dehydrogenase (quinone)